MRGIFISQAVLNKNNGGGQFVRSLILLLRKTVGVNNLTIVSMPDSYVSHKPDIEEENLIVYENNPSKMQKIKNILSGSPKLISKDINDNIINVIKKGQFDFVFFGMSTYKYLAKRISKELGIPVIVMYQGIAPNSIKSRLVGKRLLEKVKKYPSYYLVKNREKCVEKFSNCNIVHNNRDRDAFFHYYKKEPDFFLPVFISDKFSEEKGINPGYKDFSLLFVGSYFGPNLSGIKWFTENVMSKLPEGISLYIVGQGMKVLENENLYKKDNIHIIGEVEELAPWYYHADLVVEPIFEGDGMKTKTVEAMMFGKTVLGTDEAFCGYEGLDKYLCNTAEEFVDKIVEYSTNGVDKYNDEIRNIYLQKYSENAVLNTMKKIIGKFGKI